MPNPEVVLVWAFVIAASAALIGGVARMVYCLWKESPDGE